MKQSVYEYILEQETAYKMPIPLEDGWNWSMKDSLKRWFLYKNSQFEEDNENRDLRPNKNIILGIRNLENRIEGFDVKDVDLYVNDKFDYYQSYLVRKYHDEIYALKNHIDIRIDESVDSYGDYGGCLAQKKDGPVIIDLRTLAFCNQTDILAYPFCIKHTFSPQQLRDENSNWGKEGATISIEGLIELTKDEKEIFVYELHGVLPSEWLSDDGQEGEIKDQGQIQIVAYYQKPEGDKIGVTLFKKREPKLPFKFLKRDEIKGRGLGRSGIEELVESQKWTNWDEIKVTEMLEAASKMIGLTDNPSVASKHPSGLKDVSNWELIEVTQGTKGVWQLDTTPKNLPLFNDSLERWNAHAREIGSASESLLTGDTPSAMPFKLYEAKNIEDKSMHRFRQGQIADWWAEIYRDWIVIDIAKEVAQDQEFLADIDPDQMEKIADNVAIKEWNKYVINKTLYKEEDIYPEEKDQIIAQAKADFLRGGLKRFIQFFKGEIKKPLAVRINIAGKQKNLALFTDKIVGVVRQFLATPQLRQDPEMVKLLNTILESSGLSPIIFGLNPQSQMTQMAQGQGQEGLKQMSQTQMANQMV